MYQQPYDPAAVAAAKRRRGRRIGLAVGVPFAVLIVLATLANAGSDDDAKADAKPPATVPAYEITEQDDSGNQRTVRVNVDSTEGLDVIFKDVAAKLTDDAGWFVQINCSTGGTAKMDNRLANGRKAVGRIGAATTGLDDGKTEFEAQPNPECPAK